jgi:hypothetical protein
MELDCPYLSLARHWADEDDPSSVVLVRQIDALRLCRDGSCEEASQSAALWAFEEQSHGIARKVRDFAVVAGLANPYSTRFQDDDLAELVRDAIEQGQLVGVAWTGSSNSDTDATLAQRSLVRDIESRTRGRLSEGGRPYKLVAGLDLSRVPERNSYEVVERNEAQRVLGELAKQAAANLAPIFAKARDLLTPDWRPPLPPKGLVLLRRIHAPKAVVASQEPALTPSQLWGKAGKEDDDIIDWTIWIELDPTDPKASDDVVILLDEFYQEVIRKPLASCPREGTGVLVKFEKIGKHDRFTLIRDYGPNEGGGQDTLFIASSPAEMDERGSQAS